MLTVIGDLVEDVVVWTTGTMRRGTDNVSTIRRARGGSAANVAAAAAPLVASRFIGRVGADAAGDGLVGALRDEGVDVRVQRGGRTGTVVVLVDPLDGERTMFPDRGSAVDLEPVPTEWLAGTTILHVPAYGFTAEPAASSILDAIGTARSAAGAAISIDVSAVTLVESYGVDAFRALLDRLDPDLVFANAEEAAAVDLLAPSRRPRPGAVWVVKDGPRPARLVHTDGVEEVPAIPVEVVRDTTGAGDAFAAGYLAALTAHPGSADVGVHVEACRAGHRIAAAILGTPGAG